MNINQKPLVSIVIPTFNCQKFLCEAIDSALNQSYSNIEILVIDDGSTDNTSEVIKKFGRKIRYIKKDHGGLASARNEGMSLARGEFIAWLDSDDICHPYRIITQLKYLLNNPLIGLVSSSFSAFNSKGEISPSYINEYYSTLKHYSGFDSIYSKSELITCNVSDTNTGIEKIKILVFSGEIYDKLIWGNFIHPPTIMIRREAYLKAGFLDEGIPTSEDWEYFLSIANNSPVAFIDFPLLKYRISKNQMSLLHDNLIATAILIVVYKNIVRNPHFYLSRKKQFKKMLSNYHSKAAYVLSDRHPKHSIEHLLKSLKYDYRNTTILKTIVKILLPYCFIQILREMRKN